MLKILLFLGQVSLAQAGDTPKIHGNCETVNGVRTCQVWHCDPNLERGWHCPPQIKPAPPHVMEKVK